MTYAKKIGDDEEDKDKETDPSDRWDAKHKYDVIGALEKNDYSKAVMHATHLIKNAFLDVCPMPNTYNILLAIPGRSFTSRQLRLRGSS